MIWSAASLSHWPVWLRLLQRCEQLRGSRTVGVRAAATEVTEAPAHEGEPAIRGSLRLTGLANETSRTVRRKSGSRGHDRRAVHPTLAAGPQPWASRAATPA